MDQASQKQLKDQITHLANGILADLLPDAIRKWHSRLRREPVPQMTEKPALGLSANRERLRAIPNGSLSQNARTDAALPHGGSEPLRTFSATRPMTDNRRIACHSSRPTHLVVTVI